MHDIFRHTDIPWTIYQTERQMDRQTGRHSLPVVGELELQTGMVSSFYGDDVSAEVGAEEQADGFNDVCSLGLVSRQRQNCELLIRSQHHQIRPKHHPEPEQGKVLLNRF